MIFAPKPIILKDGRAAILRSPDPIRDAEAMLDYLKITSGETEFVIRYPEECTMTLEQEIRFLSRFPESPDDVMIACEIDGRLVGNCQLSRRTRRKTAHRAAVAIALIREVWGLGIGSAMFAELIAIAEQSGVSQLELAYVDGNARGRRLYEKMGFGEYGRLPDAFRLRDSTMRDEILMLRRLDIN